MPEKISILKESGETLVSNIVSVFMIPETGKRYIITTENAVDPHGLTVLHVSEIVDGTLQRVATDDEWSSIKTIMRAIISGNVGSYQYLPVIENIKSNGQYSRDISVSASASKQMIDNYSAADKSNNLAGQQVSTPAIGQQPVSSSVESVQPANVQGPVTQSNIMQPSVPVNNQLNVSQQPINQTMPVEHAPQQVPIQPTSIFPEANPSVNSDEEVIPGIAELPGGVSSQPVNNPVVQPVMPPVDSNQNNMGVSSPVPSALSPVDNVANAGIIPPIVESPVNPVGVVSGPTNPIDNNLANTNNSVNPQPIVVENNGVNKNIDGLVNNLASNSVPIPSPSSVSPVPITPVNSINEDGVNAPLVGVQVVNPNQIVPTAQIAQNVQTPIINEQPLLKNENFAPNATLDEVVLGAQEMFMEGVKNLVQTIQEKVYRDLYAKEAELKAREEALNQREKMMGGNIGPSPVSPLNNGAVSQMGMMSQQNVANTIPTVVGPTIVSADNDK